MYRLNARAAALIAVMIIAALAAPAPASDGARAAAPLKKVHFTYAPTAPHQRVVLAGTFNGWSTDATPMRLEGGKWVTTLLLPVGEYQYKFVADGNWITDRAAEKFHPDGYGGRNSVVVVGDAHEGVVMSRGDGSIVTADLRHRDNAWERSLGTDGAVTLRMRAYTGDVEAVELCIREPGDDCIPMRRFDSDGTFDYYEARVHLPDFKYFFRLRDGDSEVIVDRAGPHREPPAGISLFSFSAAQVAAFQTPDWVKQAVIYQIFPERFANGSRENDPDFSEWYYEGLTSLPPTGRTNEEYFHLVDDWYDIAGLRESPYKTDGKPDWNSFYGGDIEGVRQNLDYLADLGVTCIYFNPIFEAKSNHKYDAATYMKVDPHFGTNDEFRTFVGECHEYGIHVVIDLAFNHTGHTFWAFVDAREKGVGSEYWDWYEFKKWPVPGDKVHAPYNAGDYYDCWWGFGQMPNLNFDLSRPNAEEQNIVDIDDARPNWPMVNHLLDVAEFWLAEMDVDGYRLDVAADVPFWFWELFRRKVKEAKPEAYIVGELWGESPQWVNGRYYDAVMNYKFFRDPVMAFIGREEMTAAEFDRALAPGRLIYPDEGVRAMMNLIDSHDTERFLTAVGRDIRRYRLAMLFSMTYVGAPTIYYGDEIAMEGGGDPDCRRPFHWKWPDEKRRVETHAFVRKLARIRREHICLALGSFETLLARDMVYAYRRYSRHEQVFVVINAGKDDATVAIPVESSVMSVMDALRDRTIATMTGEGGRTLTLELPAHSGGVFIPSGSDYDGGAP
jgi:cyclomaltodextrinase